MSYLRLAALVALAGFVGCSNDAPRPVSAFETSAAPATTVQPALLPSALPGSAPAALPPGHPALPASDFQPDAPRRGAGDGASALTWTVPAGWSPVTPSSTMRRAQYSVPGAAGVAECVVFYFGPGQGGDAASNADRWAGQFRLADGGDGRSALKKRGLVVGGLEVLVVEVHGTYVGGMGGTDPTDRPGYMLLGAIAGGPDANWFFKLTGPERTVEAQRAAFDGMVRSLKKGS